MVLSTLFLCLSLQAGDEVVAPLQSWIAQGTSLEKPEFRRISDATEWLTFWKAHTKSNAAPPVLNPRSQMALVLPMQIAHHEQVAPIRQGSPTQVIGLKTGGVFQAQVSVEVQPTGQLPDPAAKPRTLVTIVIFPRSLLPVEYVLRAGPLIADAAFGSKGKLEGMPGAVTMKGALVWNPLEGGFWNFKADGKSYDLHGPVKGFKSGDLVEVFGRVEAGTACIHMCGTPFELESVRAAK